MPRTKPTDAMISSNTAMMRLTSHIERTLKCDLTLSTKNVTRYHQSTAPPNINMKPTM